MGHYPPPPSPHWSFQKGTEARAGSRRGPTPHPLELVRSRIVRCGKGTFRRGWNGHTRSPFQPINSRSESRAQRRGTTTALDSGRRPTMSAIDFDRHVRQCFVFVANVVRGRAKNNTGETVLSCSVRLGKTR